MRILILCHEFFPEAAGGAQGVGYLAKELAKNHEIDVVTKSLKGMPWKETRGRLTVYRVPVMGTTSHGTATIISMLSYTFFCTIWASILIFQRRHAIINGQFGIPGGLIAVAMGRLFKLPSLVSLVGAEIYDPPTSDQILALPFVKMLVRWTVENGDQVTALSQSMVRHLRSDFGIGRDCKVLPFGIPHIPELERMKTRQGDKRNGIFNLLCVGRLVSRKRQSDLIRALGHMPGGLKVRLKLVGDGAERTALMGLVDQLGLNDRVEFTGTLVGKPKWEAYRAADAFSLVSEHECQGVVYLEAMMAGLPVIAGDDGGQRDFLKDKWNSFLLKIGDVAGIANAIKRLAMDPELSAQMSEASQSTVAEYTVEKVAKQYCVMLEVLLTNSGHKPSPSNY